MPGSPTGSPTPLPFINVRLHDETTSAPSRGWKVVSEKFWVDIGNDAVNIIVNLVLVLVLVIIFAIIFRILFCFLQHVGDKWQKRKGNVWAQGGAGTILVYVLRILLWLSVVPMLVTQLGLSPVAETVIKFVSAIGIAIGVAMRASIETIFSGLFLGHMRPFDANDMVEVGGIRGRVKESKLAFTKVQKNNGEIVSMNNHIIFGSKLVNFTRHGRIREEVQLPLAFDVDYELFEIQVVEALEADPDILNPECHPGCPRPDVQITAVTQTAMWVQVRAWVEPHLQPKATHIINRAVRKRIRTMPTSPLAMWPVGQRSTAAGSMFEAELGGANLSTGLLEAAKAAVPSQGPLGMAGPNSMADEATILGVAIDDMVSHHQMEVATS